MTSSRPSIETPRFQWLASLVGEDLTGTDLSDAEEAWAAAAQAAGTDLTGLTQRVADRFRLPVLELSDHDLEVASLLDESVARSLLAVPVAANASRAVVATCDPGNPDLTQHLEFLLRRNIEVGVAPPSALLPALIPAGGASPEASAEWSSPDDTEEDGKVSIDELSMSSPGLLDKMIVRGIRMGASDVHFQATGNSASVRFRVDGVLGMGPHFPLSDLSTVLGRAKALGGMDPSIRMRPQDGRARIYVEGDTFDLRLSAIPASHAESLVIRILAQHGSLDLDTYGAGPEVLSRLDLGFLSRSSGIFTVTGPTGSGKTTLLYSMLDKLNTPERHIHTVEDPVEVEMKGLAQVQINQKAGLTFETALRSILRQDPDVILVGETRDPETAKTVTQAALTGHLVATTLHTIDASTALLRYRDLGVDPNELAEALNGASAQRLLRKLCPNCREPVTEAIGEHEEYFAQLTGQLPAFRAGGCDRCRSTGYSGRWPAVEVLLVGDEIRKVLLKGASLEETRDAARASGMKTMAEVVVKRAADGDVDVEEIRRVMGSDLLSHGHLAPVGTAGSAGSAAPASPSKSHPTMASANRDKTALVLTRQDSTIAMVEEALTPLGLSVHQEVDVPTAAVWIEIEPPLLVIVDLTDPSRHPTGARLSAVLDAYDHLDVHHRVVFLLPDDLPVLEGVLLSRGWMDAVRAPLSAEKIKFAADAAMRRAAVLAGMDDQS